MTTDRTFFVPGIPATKGSTKSFYNPKAKKVVTMADNRESQKQWEARVTALARQAQAPFVTATPVEVRIVFKLPRPKGHYGTGRNAGQLKNSAPSYPSVKPDVDKLIRAVLDGLTGVIYRDDAQVVSVAAIKSYTDVQPGASISLRYL